MPQQKHISEQSKDELLGLHRQAHRDIEVAMNALDLQGALGFIEKRDAAALSLMTRHGLKLVDLGANALGTSLSHFRDLVAQGTYAMNLGYPSRFC